jgi:serine/threonine-protein kinase
MGFRKIVAIKRIHPHLVRDNEQFQHSLINEARVGGLLRHHNIVETYELAQDGDECFVVMEFVDGVTLDEVIAHAAATAAPLPTSLVLDMMEQVCRGLHHAHTFRDPDGEELHLVHRDLKPVNLMLAGDGVVKIMDFGIARAASNLYQTSHIPTSRRPGSDCTGTPSAASRPMSAR